MEIIRIEKKKEELESRLISFNNLIKNPKN
jgi:hypothetical protein